MLAAHGCLPALMVFTPLLLRDFRCFSPQLRCFSPQLRVSFLHYPRLIIRIEIIEDASLAATNPLSNFSRSFLLAPKEMIDATCSAESTILLAEPIV